MFEASAGRARVLIALGLGIAIGAVAISAYAFHVRIPTGRSAEALGPATGLLGGLLVVAVIALVLTITIALFALAGRNVRAHCYTFVVAVAGVAAYALLSGTSNNAADLLASPFAKPVVGLAQTSWVLLAVAAISLTAGVVAAPPARYPSIRLALRGWSRASAVAGAVGLVVALIPASVIALTYAPTRGTTAGRVDVPAVPTKVGEQTVYSVSTPTTAYSFPIRDADWIVPAGPGFVLAGEDAIVAYDGASGAERWRFPVAGLGKDCVPSAFRSTGIGDDAIVIVECFNRVPLHIDEPFSWVLTAFDAMTGQLLWTRDDAGRLQGRILLGQDGIPLSRGDDLALVDPATGATKWQRTVPGSGECGYRNRFVNLEHSIAYVPTCSGDVLHLFDRSTGAERSIELAADTATPPGTRTWDVAAAEADALLLRSDDPGGNSNSAWIVDTRSGDVTRVQARGYVPYSYGRESGQYPGPVVQTGNRWAGSRDDEDFVDLYLLEQRRTVVAPKVHVDDFPTMQILRWALVGDRMVNTNTYRSFDDQSKTLTSVAPDGTFTSRPSPCGETQGGVLPVPGAVLLVCARGPEPNSTGITSYEILGMR